MDANLYNFKKFELLLIELTNCKSINENKWKQIISLLLKEEEDLKNKLESTKLNKGKKKVVKKYRKKNNFMKLKN